MVSYPNETLYPLRTFRCFETGESISYPACLSSVSRDDLKELYIDVVIVSS